MERAKRTSRLRSRQRRAKTLGRPWLVENLESRLLLTAYVVTTLADTIAADGHVSLREAIAAAVTGAASGDALAGTASNSIAFDPSLTLTPQVLNLTTALPDLTGNISITGPGSDRLTIARNSAGSFRLFTMDAGATATIQGLKLTGGSATAGGAILNQGSLSLSGDWITGNAVSGSGTASGGGGVSNIAGVLTISASTISSNSATGTNTGGGGIDNINGTLTITNTTITNNTSSGNQGGALRVQGNSSVSILSSTIYANVAPALRPGIYVQSGKLAIGNSLLAGNLPLAQPDIFWLTSGSVTSLGFNYIGAITTGVGSNFATGANHDQLGSTSARLFPLLGPLQVNATGMPPTMLPFNGSEGSLLDAGTALGLAFDANGQARTFDDTGVTNAPGSDGTDIGAMEAGPHIAVIGNSITISNGSLAPSAANNTDFGTLTLGGTVTETFTVTNSGQRPLMLGAVSVPAGYVTNRTSAWSVASGSSDTFTVTFTDSGVGGAHAGLVSLGTNDASASPFAFQVNATVLGPKLTVLSNEATGSGSISDGESTPSWNDGTYFGTIRPGSAGTSRTFTLRNDGNIPLTISEVDLAADPEFSLPSTLDPQTLNPGQTAQFTVDMAAQQTAGSANGVIDVIWNDTADFHFNISGVTGDPLQVTGNGNAIINNATSPSVANGTNFGTAPANSTGPTQTYTVFNDGQTPLSLSDLFIPAGYTLAKGLASTLAPGQGDTLQVQLNTAVGGTWNGNLSFKTSDPAEPLFDFAATGSVPQYLDLFTNHWPALPNADGSVVIAVNSNDYWTASGGLATLPPLIINGSTANFVNLKSISPDGTVFGGQVGLDNNNQFGPYQAFVWSQQSGYKLLTGSGANAQVMSLSNGGQHASGITYVNGVATSVIWDTPLGTPVANDLTSADGTGGFLSSDGSLGVFGGMRWSLSGGLVPLTPAISTANPIGTAISSDGYIVGYGYFNVNTPVATIWTPQGVPAQMAPGFAGMPSGVSTGGTTVVGNGLNSSSEAFVWNAAGGPQTLESFFAAQGLSTAGLGLTNTNLTISADGNVIGGNVRNGVVSTDGYLLALRGYKANTPPQITLPANLTILEGQTLALSPQISSANEDSSLLNVTWDLDNDGLFGETGPAAARGDETGQNVTLSAAGLLGPATLTISCRVTDSFGLTTTITRQVTIAAPAIGVQGQGQAIANGDLSPRLLDGTLLNPVTQGSAPPTQSFVVQNTGTGALSISSVTLPAGYSIIQALPSTIASGSQATLVFGLSTATAGSFGGLVVINSSDHANGAYAFDVAGSVLANAGPAIATVLDSVSLVSIADHSGTPSTANSTDFGHAILGGAGPTRTFIVRDDGAPALTLSNLFIPAGFSLVKAPASTLAPGQSDTLVLQLISAVGGTWNGRISFKTNDPAAPLFDFAVTGSVSQFIDLFQSKSPAVPNADGSVIIAVDSNAYWTQAGGMATLPPLLINSVPATFVHLKTVSPDGTVFGGQVGLDNNNQFGSYQAFVWSQQSGYILLDGPGANAAVMSLSNNGAAASGIAYVNGVATSVIWGTPLTAPAPNYLTAADGTGGFLSADASMGVFGGMRWTSSGGLVPLTPAPNTVNPVGTAISSDGYIVGYGYFNVNTPVATIWTPQGVPAQMAPGFAGTPSGVSTGGTTVVGNGLNSSSEVFVWNAAGGPQTIENYLASQGISTINYAFTNTNIYISADGQTITGNLRNGLTNTTDGYVLSLRGYSANTPPVPALGGPFIVLQGDTLQLAGSATDAAQTGDTLTYQWDLNNDGIFGETGAAATRGDENGTAPIFSAAGLIGPSTYPIALKVTDSYGLSTTITGTIQINQPTISLSTSGPENSGALNRGSLPAMIPYSLAGATGPTGTFKWTQPNGLGTTVYISYSFSNLLDGTLQGGLSTNQIRAAAEQAMAIWASVAPIVFVEVPDSGPDPRVIGNGDYPAAGNPMIRFGQRNIITDLALTNIPNSATSGQSGDVNLNSSVINWALAPEQGVDLRQVFLHELGLALGLNEASVGQSASIMSGYDGRFTNGVQPQINALDVQAIQGVYGSGQGGVYSLFPPAISLPISSAPLLAGLSLTGVRIFDVPAGAALSAGTNEGNGTWLVAPYQLQGLMIRPPANFHGDITLPFTVFIADSTTRQGNIDVSVAAVAYAPNLIVNGTAQGDAGTPIYLPVLPSFAVPPGNDGVLSLQVSGVPATATVSGGTSLGNGSWSVDPANIGLFSITPALGASNFTLQLTATDLQASDGASASTSLSLPVIVVPILPDAFEPFDNSIAQATYLPRDVIQAHSIASAGDVDWYTFDVLRDNSEIDLRVRSPNDAATPLTANLTLTLYGDSQQTQLLAQTNGDLAMTGMLAGQYYLKVQDASPSGVANYTIQLGISDPSAIAPVLVGTASASAPGRDFYDNPLNYPLDLNHSSPVANAFGDDRVSAGVPVLTSGNQLDVSGAASRSIYATGDVDWSQFTLVSRSYVSLLAYDPTTSLDPTQSLPVGALTIPTVIKGTLSVGSGSVTGLTTVAALRVGQPVSGPGIASGTTITAINSANHSITLSSLEGITQSNASLTITTIRQPVPAIICIFNSSASSAQQITNIFDTNSAFPTVQSKFAATLDSGTYYVLIYRYNNGGTIPSYDLNLAITPTADATRPTAAIGLASGQASPTSASAVDFVAQFSKPVTGLTGAGLILPAGVSASVTPMNASNGFASSYNILATGITASTTVTVGLADSAARDASGNTSVAVSPGQPVVTVTKTTLAGAYLFYKGSAFDIGSDDNAIAPDKQPLFPGNTASFANYSSYSRGINGLMIDIAGFAGTLTASDFVFKVGNDNNPANWTPAPAPLAVVTRPGQGVSGAARVEITWADNAIEDQWLQVTVKGGPGSDSGLSADTVFYFGNAIGDVGDSLTDARVNATDELTARFGATANAAISNPADYNRDGIVDAADQSIARANYSYFLNQLNLIQAPGGSSEEAAAPASPVVGNPGALAVTSTLMAIPMGLAIVPASIPLTAFSDAPAALLPLPTSHPASIFQMAAPPSIPSPLLAATEPFALIDSPPAVGYMLVSNPQNHRLRIIAVSSFSVQFTRHLSWSSAKQLPSLRLLKRQDGGPHDLFFGNYDLQ